MTPEQIIALYFISGAEYKQRWDDAEDHLDGKPK